jgi:uncharacterized protein YcbX
MHTITVRDLFIYPVKSARGIAVDEATVTDRGFENDRRFMVVDEESRFLTQRKYPQMALIDVRIERGGSAGAARLVLEAPDAGGIAVPLRPEGGERRTVEVWDDRCEALSMGPDARRFFERILGIPGDLVYMPDETARLANPAYSTPGAKVSFVDAYSYLVIAEASLGELNAHLKEPVPMNRFRPNIVIEGCEPYAEDGFRAVSIGEVPFRATELCPRCVLITVDQATGVKEGNEPLATLTKLRRQGQGVPFGQYLIQQGSGVVRRGDKVALLPD